MRPSLCFNAFYNITPARKAYEFSPKPQKSPSHCLGEIFGPQQQQSKVAPRKLKPKAKRVHRKFCQQHICNKSFFKRGFFSARKYRCVVWYSMYSMFWPWCQIQVSNESVWLFIFFLRNLCICVCGVIFVKIYYSICNMYESTPYHSRHSVGLAVLDARLLSKSGFCDDTWLHVSLC